MLCHLEKNLGPKETINMFFLILSKLLILTSEIWRNFTLKIVFIYTLFNKYLLSAYCVSGTFVKCRGYNKQNTKIHTSLSLYSSGTVRQSTKSVWHLRKW